MAKSINAIRYLECSAKHNRGVKECFQETAKVALSGKPVLITGAQSINNVHT
jgi:Rho family protein